MKFRTTVELGGKTATGFEVPREVVTALDAGKRPPVTVTIRNHIYETTVAPMGGRFMVPLSAENRTAAEVSAGDEVEVDLQLSSGPRDVAVPPDFADALAGDEPARQFFHGLSYSHRREWVRWITEAKKAETRTARISKALESLAASKRTH